MFFSLKSLSEQRLKVISVCSCPSRALFPPPSAVVEALSPLCRTVLVPASSGQLHFFCLRTRRCFFHSLTSLCFTSRCFSWRCSEANQFSNFQSVTSVCIPLPVVFWKHHADFMRSQCLGLLRSASSVVGALPRMLRHPQKAVACAT